MKLDFVPSNIMNSIEQGRVTKNLSCEKCCMLKGVNFILRKLVEQKSWKMFILNDENQKLKQHNKYLESTLDCYQSEEKLLEAAGLTRTNTKSEIESKRKIKDHVSSISSHATETKIDYWKCVWCLTEYGNPCCFCTYSSHIHNCKAKKFLKRCYQNESMTCYKCYGVKVVFKACFPVYAKPNIFCGLCSRRVQSEQQCVKHVLYHERFNTFICSCRDNYVYKQLK